MPLSAMAVARAKPTNKPYKLRDERGMFLLMTPSGGRYWRFNFRFDGQYRTLAFGTYPDVSLAEARAKREAARKLIAEGLDPSQARKEEAAKAGLDASSTFKHVAEEWLAKREREGLGEVTLSQRPNGS